MQAATDPGMSLYSTRRSSRWCSVPRLGLLALGMTLCVGCHDYRWRWDYQQAEQQARDEGRPLFIFYKWWLSNESNRMHGDVLADPQVGRLFEKSINLLLEKESSTEYGKYVSKYGVNAAPAFIVAQPDGTYQVLVGYVSKERFIEFVRKAMSPPDKSGSGAASPPANRKP